MTAPQALAAFWDALNKSISDMKDPVLIARKRDRNKRKRMRQLWRALGGQAFRIAPKVSPKPKKEKAQ